MSDQATIMTVASSYRNDAPVDAVRVRFAFQVAESGTHYVNMNRSSRDLIADALRAARRVVKRADVAQVMLLGVTLADR